MDKGYSIVVYFFGRFSQDTVQRNKSRLIRRRHQYFVASYTLRS